MGNFREIFDGETHDEQLLADYVTVPDASDIGEQSGQVLPFSSEGDKAILVEAAKEVVEPLSSEALE